jgi:hypothetical protein
MWPGHFLYYTQQQTLYNMQVDIISKASLKIYDELKKDSKSKGIINQIDEGQTDLQLTAAIKKGVKRLRELGKNDVADEIESMHENFKS